MGCLRNAVIGQLLCCVATQSAPGDLDRQLMTIKGLLRKDSMGTTGCSAVVFEIREGLCCDGFSGRS